MSGNNILSKKGDLSRRQMAGMREPQIGHRDGFALVVVLAVIVLLVVLIVGFVSSAGTERTAASGYHSSVMTRQLADTAVNLIQGQINMATTQGSEVAWASQPGMIRTYSNANGGPLVNAYKLYSAGEMISKTVSLTADLPPGSWSSDTAIWTDLNAPVEVKGSKHYPILDPSSLGNAGQVPEGFSITNAPGSTSYQQAPMPVRWLYVLSDGSIVTPSNANGKTATIPGATATNPIVGRMAFWTDDDTTKVNINTASDGTYWDTPRTLSNYEVKNLAPNQPAYREFQRYPGHPAMTSLRSVFPFLTAAQIYSIVPRIQGGGSNQGTVTADSTSAVSLDSDRLYSNIEELVFRPNHSTQNDGLSPQQVERAKFFLSARSRSPETNLFNLPRIACWPIYRMATDGTANATRTTVSDRLIAFCSSTGELGTSTFYPYIFQRENAQSSTNDINISRNIDLYNYLRYLTGKPVPGFGGNFSAKYGLDRDQILTEIFDYIRCVNLRDSSLPNWSNPVSTAFATTGWVVPTKYTSAGNETMGFGRYYSLSELGIAFICNADGNYAPSNILLSADPKLGNRVLNANIGPTLPPPAPAPTPEPLKPDEKYIQAIIAPEFFSPMQGFIGINTSFFLNGVQVITETESCITISGLNSLSVTDSKGTHPLFPPSADNAVARYGTNQSFYNSLPFGGNPTYRYFAIGHNSPERGAFPADSAKTPKDEQPYKYVKEEYPFIGVPVKISTGGGSTMRFSGGTLEIKIYGGSAPSSASLIQTLSITLPGSDIPIPEITKTTDQLDSTDPANLGFETVYQQNWWGFAADGVVGNPFGSNGNNGAGYFGRFHFLQQNKPAGVFFHWKDTLRTVHPSHGDYRLVAASPTGGGSLLFTKHRDYDDTARRTAALFSEEYGLSIGLPDNDRRGKLVPGAEYNTTTASTSIPDFPSNYSGATNGDFDTGIANLPDGPYVNKSDEGDTNIGGSNDAYFMSVHNWGQTKALGSTLFSPNRQMPSPGMFGSLSTGVQRGLPWQTLLFRPQPSHPNYSTTIPDHLMMDLFWMPVVEPYAISDRFSTAGKINMNCQILPFTYIKRETGIYATLKAEKMAVIPTIQAPRYKGGQWTYGNPASFNSRLDINVEETLNQFQAKFSSGEIFKSASEICDIHIVPVGSTVSQMQGNFWTANALTGENLREKIYTTLYPRLTTKSNTYTVHFQVQALKKLPASSGIAVDTWTEGRDVVLGEYRGSTSIERFIDANNKDIPNYAANPANIGNSSTPTLDRFYRWRVIENRQFAP